MPGSATTTLRPAIVFTCAALAASGCDPALTVPGAAGEGTLIEGLVYSGNDDGVELFGDLYLPRPAIARPPVVVLVHGGGFFEGDRRDQSPLAEELTGHGIAAYAIDYRLVGEGGEFPGALVDVLDAVRYLRAHHEDLEIGDVCGVWGTSAGGTLAALAALLHTEQGLSRAGWAERHGVSDSVEALAAAYGVYDFTTREEQHGSIPGPEQNFLGGDPGRTAAGPRAAVPQPADRRVRRRGVRNQRGPQPAQRLAVHRPR